MGFQAKPPIPLWQPASQFAADALVYLPLSEGSGNARNVSRKALPALTPQAGAGWTSTPYGKGVTHNLTGSWTIAIPAAFRPVKDNLTLAVLVRNSANGNAFTAGLLDSNSRSLTGLRSITSNGNTAAGQDSDTNVFTSTPNVAGVVGQWIVQVMTISGTSLRYYLNGALAGTNTIVASVATVTQMAVGASGAASGNKAVTDSAAAGLWTVAKDPAWIAALSADWLSGRFSLTRPRRSVAVLQGTAAAFLPAWAARANTIFGGGM